MFDLKSPQKYMYITIISMQTRTWCRLFSPNELIFIGDLEKKIK